MADNPQTMIKHYNDLTRDEILSIQGRELDTLVAEHVMGFKFEVDKVKGLSRWVGYGAYGEAHTPPMAWKKWEYRVPPYSKDISAAWEVAEKFHQFTVMRSRGWEKQYYCCIWVGITGEQWSATAKTAPLAICRASLLAVME